MVLSCEGITKCGEIHETNSYQMKIGEEAMLVVTRKRDEEIRIGSNIVVRVTKISGNKVKIGIEAPDSVRIVRGEIATDLVMDAADVFGQNEEELMADCVCESMFVQN